MTKYIVGVYGPWGTVDVRYVQLQRGGGGRWRLVTDTKEASRFNALAKAVAFSKGVTGTGTYGATIEPTNEDRSR